MLRDEVTVWWLLLLLLWLIFRVNDQMLCSKQRTSTKSMLGSCCEVGILYELEFHTAISTRSACSVLVESAICVSDLHHTSGNSRTPSAANNHNITAAAVDNHLTKTFHTIYLSCCAICSPVSISLHCTHSLSLTHSYATANSARGRLGLI